MMTSTGTGIFPFLCLLLYPPGLNTSMPAAPPLKSLKAEDLYDLTGVVAVTTGGKL